MIRLGVLQVADAVVYLPGASFTNYPCFLNLHPHLPQYMVPEGFCYLGEGYPPSVGLSGVRMENSGSMKSNESRPHFSLLTEAAFV